MATRNLALALLAMGAMFLSACGDTGGFKAKMQAQCETMDKTADCGCAVDVLDRDLDAKTKALMVAIVDARAAGGTQVDALKTLGLSPEEGTDMIKAAIPAMAKALASCKKN